MESFLLFDGSDVFIGIRISRKLARMMHDDLQVESSIEEPNSGRRPFFIFPYIPGHRQTQEVATAFSVVDYKSTHEYSSDDARKIVLAAEDDEVSRKMVQRMMRTCDMTPWLHGMAPKKYGFLNATESLLVWLWWTCKRRKWTGLRQQETFTSRKIRNCNVTRTCPSRVSHYRPECESYDGWRVARFGYR